MTRKDYTVGSTTPLYDAIAKGIGHVKSLASKGAKVMVMVDTDGYENASSEHTQESITKLIDECKKAGWAFMFMSAGVDRAAAAQVATIGASLGMTTRSASHLRRSASYGAAAMSTQSYFASGAQPVSMNIDDQEDAKDKGRQSGASVTSDATATGVAPPSGRSSGDESWTRERPTWSGAA